LRKDTQQRRIVDDAIWSDLRNVAARIACGAEMGSSRRAGARHFLRGSRFFMGSLARPIRARHHVGSAPERWEESMRSQLLIPAVAAGVVAAFALAGWGMAAPRPAASLADLRVTAIPVDTELVIAVDVSNSMDPEEQALQREGYILGLTSPEFLQAVKMGANARIAITYFEWASIYDQKVILPWRVIDGPASAQAVVDQIKRTPYRRAPRTSIYGALQFAKPLFDTSGYNGLRHVIDVSGDGTNNMGPPVTIMRDQVLNAGATINGLPIMLNRPYGSGTDIPNLDVYYEDCVIGGPGSFVIAIHDREQFKQATRDKLVQEIAAVPAKPRVIPAQARSRSRVYCS
jgi:hypothetical protein